MSHKTIAYVLFGVYALISYGAGFIRPRKCSDHETPEERYKVAVRAPFMTLLGVAMAIGLTWATIEAFFQP